MLLYKKKRLHGGNYLLMRQKISIKSGEAAKGDAKGFINPLAGGVRGVTPYSVGRCHEVTEGTGDR